MTDVSGLGNGDASAPLPRPTNDQLLGVLEALYSQANSLVENGTAKDLLAQSGEIETVAARLAKVDHAARGALLTLLLYKICQPGQDIRYSKVEHPGGFSARTVDAAVTVPFLLRESLPRKVESHWLTQTLSFAEPWTRAIKLKTQPKSAGPDLIDAVNLLEELPPEKQQETAKQLALVVLVELINERNRGRVQLTRPKGLTIASVLEHLEKHFNSGYKSAAPRLPQLAIYAIYESLLKAGVGRYNDWTLDPIRRMKAADRKAGTVGDIVLSDAGKPVDAVETKFDIPVSVVMVAEAMEKIRTATVDRYFVLSTAGVLESDRDAIVAKCRDFRRSNGCEVIVNGVLDTVRYYLRLLPSTTDFISAYAGQVEQDEDLNYEHRVAWNAICDELAGNSID